MVLIIMWRWRATSGGGTGCCIVLRSMVVMPFAAKLVAASGRPAEPAATIAARQTDRVPVVPPD